MQVLAPWYLCDNLSQKYDNLSASQFDDSLSPYYLISVGKIKPFHIPDMARRKPGYSRQLPLQVFRYQFNHRISPVQQLLFFHNSASDIPVKQANSAKACRNWNNYY